MKKIVYAATFALMCMTVNSVALASTSLNTTAYAAEATCEFVPSSAATGEKIQQQIDSIAHCNVREHSTTPAETHSLTKNMPSEPVNTNIGNTQDVLDENRSFCPAIPQGSTPEDFQYRAALEHCRYGF